MYQTQQLKNETQTRFNYQVREGKSISLLVLTQPLSYHLHRLVISALFLHCIFITWFQNKWNELRAHAASNRVVIYVLQFGALGRQPVWFCAFSHVSNHSSKLSPSLSGIWQDFHQLWVTVAVFSGSILRRYTWDIFGTIALWGDARCCHAEEGRSDYLFHKQ